jgi:hypothetical protein
MGEIADDGRLEDASRPGHRMALSGSAVGRRVRRGGHRPTDATFTIDAML